MKGFVFLCFHLRKLWRKHVRLTKSQRGCRNFCENQIAGRAIIFPIQVARLVAMRNDETANHFD